MNRSSLPRRSRAATAALAALLLVGCDDDPAPPFSIEGTGALEGLVFLDANEDGRFDPSDGDQAVSGVDLTVRERGTTSVLAGGTASTAQDGRFRIEALPPGTHELFFDEASLPEGVSVCRNPIPVSIYLDETTFRDVAGRGACLITIEEAKSQPLGSFVILRGIVTSSPGQIEASFAYVEDETAGLFVFSSVLMGQGIEVGDLIEVGGTTTVFSGQFELENVTLREHLEDVENPQPQLVTTAEIAASGPDPFHPLQNRLVRVEGAELLQAFGANGFNIQNSLIDDGTGALTIRVDDGVADRNTLNDIFDAGACYDLNGLAANFNGTGQIFLRSLDDLEEVACD